MFLFGLLAVVAVGGVAVDVVVCAAGVAGLALHLLFLCVVSDAVV